MDIKSGVVEYTSVVPAFRLRKEDYNSRLAGAT
jgi:hypothetical protein